MFAKLDGEWDGYRAEPSHDKIVRFPTRTVDAMTVVLDHKKGRDFATPRRCLHVVVGVMRRRGWRLSVKMAEGPPRNF